MNGLIDSNIHRPLPPDVEHNFPRCKSTKLKLNLKRNSTNFHNFLKWQGMPKEWLRFAGRSAKTKFRLSVWVRNTHVPPKWRVLLSGWKKNSFCVGGKNEGCGRWELSPMTLISVFGRRHWSGSVVNPWEAHHPQCPPSRQLLKQPVDKVPMLKSAHWGGPLIVLKD